MTEYDFTWNRPVELELPCGLTRRFQNAYDALDFLDAEWPTRRGPAYEQAIRLCRNALRDLHAAELARAAFIAAAEEAGMRLATDPDRLVSFLPQRRKAVA
ncbi:MULTISPECIES: DUF982 domain-containing protein [Rhizobium]|uniref:DUF982 domain-containing protein n=1 Tax=Rhizobium wuzhouense TaxID=1986026 RepID=A0ABX5NPZ2_9HYPH|nr:MULTISPECIES: DUF982 domain-containing protein [Rhizobium]PYB72550.1 DUF982 domain-containing protein [Rhizobium wuzhouense]RKE83542.1 uncharacterized protein DUF982 [Rhizobium sp. AG855]